MRYRAYFIGGPEDLTIKNMPADPPRYYFPAQPPRPEATYSGRGISELQLDAHVYALEMKMRDTYGYSVLIYTYRGMES